MISLGPVVARGRVRVERAAAWSFIVDPELRATWWPELRLDPQLDGIVAEQWSEEAEGGTVGRDASGTVDVFINGHAIGFTWKEAGDDFSTAVLITLRTQGGNTGVTITETGFDALTDSSERAAASQEGWTVLLADWAAAAERAAGVASGEAPAEVASGEVPAEVAQDVEVAEAAEEAPEEAAEEAPAEAAEEAPAEAAEEAPEGVAHAEAAEGSSAETTREEAPTDEAAPNVSAESEDENEDIDPDFEELIRGIR